ncbi:hypothetical protein C8F04DRAFT_914720, partial [Mycena alexandri]
MAPKVRWQDPDGHKILNTIVQKKGNSSQWTNGLREVHEELVAPILGGDDILCYTATGDGKSAVFSVPI